MSILRWSLIKFCKSCKLQYTEIYPLLHRRYFSNVNAYRYASKSSYNDNCEIKKNEAGLSYETKMPQANTLEYDEMIKFMEDEPIAKDELRTLEDLTIDELEEIYDYNEINGNEMDFRKDTGITYPVSLDS